jgi:hypothetical protein
VEPPAIVAISADASTLINTVDDDVDPITEFLTSIWIVNKFPVARENAGKRYWLGSFEFDIMEIGYPLASVVLQE